MTTLVSTLPKTQGSMATRPLARWHTWWRRFLIALVWFYVAILILAPLASLVASTFAEGISPVLAALSQPAALHAFRTTLVISLVTVLVNGFFGTLTAWMMVRHQLPGKRLLNGLLDLPFAVSPVVAGYMLLLLFGSDGLLGPWLESLEIKVAFALPGMILATLFVTLPFMARELIPVLKDFDVRQEQVAATLGASNWQTFRRVTFPAIRWSFVYGLTLTFARALGEFGAVLVIGSGIQGHPETLTLFIYRILDGRMYIAAYSAALVLGLCSLLLVTGANFWRRSRSSRS